MNTQENMETIQINNVEYVRKDSIQIQEVLGDYVIVRCRNAGVHAGYLKSRDAHVLTLENSRRLWRWWSKFTLSGLAIEGVLKGKEDECKFACQLPRLDLTIYDVCEVIYCTEWARNSIQCIPEHTNE